jgi:hypothetical protein
MSDCDARDLLRYRRAMDDSLGAVGGFTLPEVRLLLASIAGLRVAGDGYLPLHALIGERMEWGDAYDECGISFDAANSLRSRVAQLTVTEQLALFDALERLAARGGEVSAASAKSVGLRID